MTASRARRGNTLWLIALGATFAVASAGGGAYALHRGDDLAAFALALTLLAAPLLAVAALAVDPAYVLAAGLALSVFAGNWQHMHVPFGPERVFLLGGIGLTLLRLWRAGELSLLRIRPVHWLLFVLLVYATGSALFAGTLRQHNAFYALVDRLGITNFLLFFVAPAVFRTSDQRRILLGTLVGVAAYLGVTSLAEGVNANTFVVPKYILDPSLGIHHERARGPFLEAAANGLALYFSAVACFVAVRVWTGRRARIFAAGVGAVCLVGILFTLTRQAWVAAVAATLVTLASIGGLRRLVIPVSLFGGILVVAALTFVPGLQKKVDNRAASTRPVWDRLNSNEAAVRMVEAKPLFGFGWGRFSRDVGPYYRQAADRPLTTVGAIHSVALSNAAELGLVGALLWAAALCWAVGGSLVRRGPPEGEAWRIGLLAITLCWLIVSNFTPLDYAFDNGLLWLWAGVTWAACREDAAPKGSPTDVV